MEAIAYFAKSPSIIIDDKLNDSAIVEQAPYTPKKGILNSLATKFVDVNWFNKSPLKR